MLHPIHVSIRRLDAVYRDLPYVDGIKAKLLAAFDALIVLFVPINVGKVLLTGITMPGLRMVYNAAWLVAALVSLWMLFRGRLAAAGNVLVLGMAAAANVILLSVRVFPEPVALSFQLFILDFVLLLLALVFTSRRVAFAVLGVSVVSQFGLYIYSVEQMPLQGSLEYAADVLIRDGLIAIGFMFCLGALLVSMIESAHRRSEEALRETRATNENLERLVAERTRELQAASRLAQEASRAKGDFLANMSHEIRTPLNGIIGTADIMRRRSDMPEDMREQVRIIAASGELLLKLISDILDFSKIEAGRMVLDRHVFDLPALINDTSALLAAAASEKRVDLDCETGAGIAREYDGDSYRLRQILLNLGSNAIKFTPTGGKVWVRVSGETGGRVRFEVRDNGIGMDETTMKRVFERFTQADSTTTRRYGGTGLGLAISSRIVDALGGRLEVESVPGQGSAFHFSIPLEPASGSRPGIEAPPAPLANLGLRVLVAEDNSINRKILGLQLKQLGCVCEMAEDGEQALLALERGPDPDVVLMDCHMPKLDGWETVRRIRAWATAAEVPPARRRTAKIPVIALTAAALPEERERCMAAGMDEFLAKPVKADALQAALQAVCPAGPAAA